MKKIEAFLIALLVFTYGNVTRADSFWDKCASPEARPSWGTESLLHQAVKDNRSDCVAALLSNPNFNTRSDLLEATFRLLSPDRIFVLKIALQTHGFWIRPKKSGEEIAAFSVLVDKIKHFLQEEDIQTAEE